MFVALRKISISERGLTSTQWSAYNTGTKRTFYLNIPTSTIMAETITVDGFIVSQKDNAGITSNASRAYATNGMTVTNTDGRGNTTITTTDIAGRTILVTDADGNSTGTIYSTCCDNPATVTDAQGNTRCYRYDERGRKVAEWGTGIHLVSLTTFRGAPETNADGSPSRSGEGAAAGDETTWVYDPATGLELSKTYADNTSVVKSYDAFNRLDTETNARGRIKVHTYEPARGLLISTTYSDETNARSFAYNHLGQFTQVVDAAGTRRNGAKLLRRFSQIVEGKRSQAAFLAAWLRLVLAVQIS